MSRKSKRKEPTLQDAVPQLKSEDKASQAGKPEPTPEIAPEEQPDASEGVTSPPHDRTSPAGSATYTFPSLPEGHEVILYQETGALMDLVTRICHTAKVELTELDAAIIVQGHKAMVDAQGQSQERAEIMVRMKADQPLIEVPGFDIRHAFQVLHRRLDRMEQRIGSVPRHPQARPSTRVPTARPDGFPWGRVVGARVELHDGRKGTVITEFPKLSSVVIDFGNDLHQRLPVANVKAIQIVGKGQVAPHIRFKGAHEVDSPGNPIPTHTVDMPAEAQLEMIQDGMVMAIGPSNVKAGVEFRVGPKIYRAVKDSERQENGRYLISVELIEKPSVSLEPIGRLGDPDRSKPVNIATIAGAEMRRTLEEADAEEYKPRPPITPEDADALAADAMAAGSGKITETEGIELHGISVDSGPAEPGQGEVLEVLKDEVRDGIVEEAAQKIEDRLSEAPKAGRQTMTRRRLIGEDVLIRCTGSHYDMCVGGIAGYFLKADGQTVYSVMFPGLGNAVSVMPSVMFRPPDTMVAFFDDVELAQDANDKIPAYTGPPPLGTGVTRQEKWYAVSLDDGGHPEIWDIMDTEPESEADRHTFKVGTWDEVCQLAARLDDAFAQLGASEEASDINVEFVNLKREGQPSGKTQLWVGHPGEVPTAEPEEALA